MRIAFSLFTWITTLIALPGCTSYEHPSIDITGVRLTQATDEAAALSFGMELHNPNDEPLTLLEFEYHLDVDGKRVFEGKRAAEATLAAHSTRNMSIPAVIPFDEAHWADGMPPGAKYQLQGKLRYLTPGKFLQVLFDLGVRRPTVGFSDGGEVALGEGHKAESIKQKAQSQDSESRR